MDVRSTISTATRSPVSSDFTPAAHTTAAEAAGYEVLLSSRRVRRPHGSARVARTPAFSRAHTTRTQERPPRDSYSTSRSCQLQ